jgi:hypothetical protein
MAPASASIAYARPDDWSDDGQTWRNRLLDYNRPPNANPFNLLRAFQLCAHDAYRALADWLGIEKLFILSADGV